MQKILAGFGLSKAFRLYAMLRWWGVYARGANCNIPDSVVSKCCCSCPTDSMEVCQESGSQDSTKYIQGPGPYRNIFFCINKITNMNVS